MLETVCTFGKYAGWKFSKIEHYEWLERFSAMFRHNPEYRSQVMAAKEKMNQIRYYAV